jgi:hypothetical protein
MWDFSLGTATSIMVRTAPFLLFRIIVYFAITLGLILATGTGAGVGWGIGNFGDEEFRAGATVWGAFGGFGIAGAVLFFLRDYLLYVVKAGHLALMVEALEGRPIPQGRAQIDHAATVVKARFGQASALFALDQVIKGVITAITGLVQGLMSILPIPGLDRIMAVVRAYLRVAVGLIDEVILAHAIRTNSDNAWGSAREALVLYGQNARPMLVNAAWLTLILYGLSFVVFLVMLAPAAAVVWLMPGAWSAGGVVFALVFAWAVKAALIEPFALACLLQVFFKVTEGQTPNPEWERKLESVSDKFRAMGEKAANWMRKPAPGG